MRSNHAWVLLVAGLGILHAVSPARTTSVGEDCGFRGARGWKDASARPAR